MMKSVRDIYTRYVGGAYLAHPDVSISQKNNVVNDRNCGFVFAPKTFDTVVALSNFLVCVLGLCRFSFVLYHFSLFLFYSCPVFLLSCTFDLSFFLSVFFPPSYSCYSLQSLSLSVEHSQSGDKRINKMVTMVIMVKMVTMVIMAYWQYFAIITAGLTVR